MLKSIQIEFFSDFICPWCYIGKSRIGRLKEKLKDEFELEINLRPYILYPGIPKGGSPKSIFSKKTKPGMGRSLKHESSSENIDLAYNRIEKIPNSLEAHRLILLIEDLTSKFNLGHAIMKAYFEQGEDIGDLNILSRIAVEHGIRQELIEKFASSNEGSDQVLIALENAKRDHISVVPTIRMNQHIVIPGLQSIEVWESYLRRAVRKFS